jgi:hypothetical protein
MRCESFTVAFLQALWLASAWQKSSFRLFVQKSSDNVPLLKVFSSVTETSSPDPSRGTSSVTSAIGLRKSSLNTALWASSSTKIPEEEDMYVGDDENEDDANNGPAESDSEEEEEEGTPLQSFTDASFGAEIAEEEAHAQVMTWEERRAEGDKIRGRKATWEERFEDDPLRSDDPTVDFEEPVDPLALQFVALADVDTADDAAAAARAGGWTYHTQWLRRASLPTAMGSSKAIAEDEVRVDWAYTRLNDQRMEPCGQVVGLSANSSAAVLALMDSEPLAKLGAVGKWKVFLLDQFGARAIEAVNNPLRFPMLFVGLFSDAGTKEALKQDKEWNQKIDDGVIEDDGRTGLTLCMHDYHAGEMAGAESRVVSLANLVSIDDAPVTVGPDFKGKEIIAGRRFAGTMCLFNAPTNPDAARYINGQPLLLSTGMYGKQGESISSAGMYCISPVNQQDVDGLNHMMARTFGDMAELNDVHYLDPEDILSEEASATAADLAREAGIGAPESVLSSHLAANAAFLKELEVRGDSFRYSRMSWNEIYGESMDESSAMEWNEAMLRSQKVRLEPVVEPEIEVIEEDEEDEEDEDDEAEDVTATAETSSQESTETKEVEEEEKPKKGKGGRRRKSAQPAD